LGLAADGGIWLFACHGIVQENSLGARQLTLTVLHSLGGWGVKITALAGQGCILVGIYL
jgi:hypothetical protein